MLWSNFPCEFRGPRTPRVRIFLGIANVPRSTHLILRPAFSGVSHDAYRPRLEQHVAQCVLAGSRVECREALVEDDQPGPLEQRPRRHSQLRSP